MPRRDPLTVLTPPSAEPVTRAQLVAQLRLNDATGIDDELDRAVKSARELFELQTGRAVLPTVFRQHVDALSGDIELQAGPVISVAQVQYYDATDAQQTLAGCALDAAEIPAVVYLPIGAWPKLSPRRRRPVTIDFTAGWADVAHVPAMVKTAILLLAANFYEFRQAHDEDVLTALPEGWERIVELHRTGLEYAS